MNHQMAVALLQNHHKKVAQSVARQMLRTIPRYQFLGEDVLYRSTDQLVVALIEYLETGNPTSLRKMSEDMMELRRIGGFASAELLMAGMCFFPVLRRFFIRKAERSRIGLELYDEVEKKLFPVFVGLATKMAQEVQTDDDNEFESATFSNLADFQIEEINNENAAIGGTPFDPALS